MKTTNEVMVHLQTKETGVPSVGNMVTTGANARMSPTKKLRTRVEGQLLRLLGLSINRRRIRLGMLLHR